jgi:hypothetical protein
MEQSVKLKSEIAARFVKPLSQEAVEEAAREWHAVLEVNAPEITVATALSLSERLARTIAPSEVEVRLHKDDEGYYIAESKCMHGLAWTNGRHARLLRERYLESGGCNSASST